MNGKQKTILLLGITAIVLMGLFPPWVLERRVYGGKYTTEPGPYSWIGNPPKEPAEYKTTRVLDFGRAIWLSNIQKYKEPIPTKSKTELVKLAVEARFIDLYRLGVQFFIVAVATAGLIIALKNRNKN